MTTKPIEKGCFFYIYFMFIITLKFSEKYLYLILLILFLLTSDFANSSNDEYYVKSLFVERFTRYIEWPTNSDVNNISKPFVIGVYGDSPITTQLEILANKTKIKNKTIRIKKYDEIGQISDCNILFICSGERKSISKIITQIGSNPILTVSDDANFVNYGIMINMFIEGSNVKFDINEGTMKKAGLKASYQLLKLAMRLIN